MADDDVTIGELGRNYEKIEAKLEAIALEHRAGQEAIMGRLDGLYAQFVPRGEWEKQNTLTTRDYESALRMISTLKHQLIGVVAFVLTGALGILGAYIQAGKIG